MFRRYLSTACIAMLPVLAGTVEAATIVYDSGVQAANLTTLYGSDTSFGVGGNENSEFFTISDNHSLDSVNVTGLFFRNSVPTYLSLSMRLYAASGGAPVYAPFHSETGTDPTVSASGRTFSGLTVYDIDMNLSGYELAAGSYFISIIETGAYDSNNFYWGLRSSGSGYFSRQPLTDPWSYSSAPATFDFTLFENDDDMGAIPLPGAAGLLLAGLAGLSMMGRRRRKG